MGRLTAFLIGIQPAVELGGWRCAAIRGGKKAEEGDCGSNVQGEEFGDPAIRKGSDHRCGGRHKVIRVVRRLAAKARGRPQILTGVLDGHGPGDEAERKHNGKDGRDQCGRAQAGSAVRLRLQHDENSIGDGNRFVNMDPLLYGGRRLRWPSLVSLVLLSRSRGFLCS